MPCLEVLSSNALDNSKTAVQRSCVETLFRLIETHGRTFSEQFWLALFKDILTPFFAAMRKQVSEEGHSSSSFLKESFQIAFDSLIEGFLIYFSVARHSLPLLLDILSQAITAYTSVSSISPLTPLPPPPYPRVQTFSQIAVE